MWKASGWKPGHFATIVVDIGAFCYTLETGTYVDSQPTRMPPVARRFGEPGGNPQGNGRKPSRWLRILLDAANSVSDTGATHRDAVALNMIRIAATGDGKEAMAAVNAAIALFAYDMGKPPEAKDVESMSIRERWAALAEVAQKMAALPSGEQPALPATETVEVQKP